MRILGVATQGTGKDDETRLRGLLENFNAEFFPFDQSKKIKSAFGLFKKVWKDQPDLVVLEGTGIAGGSVLIFTRILRKIPYILSSGDAVSAFVGSQIPVLRPFFNLYEKYLTKKASGFIGWTPYLTGRALTFGAKRAMTASGWSPHNITNEEQARFRVSVRQDLGIPLDALVVGIVGSLAWNKRSGFCYGYELVSAYFRTRREGLYILIVGDGDGKKELERLAGPELGRKIFLTGKVPRHQIPSYLSAMDVASLPQSVDQVGAFRYSTKLTEYMSLRLPIIMGQVPMSYDLPGHWFWRLSGCTPWSEEYVCTLAALLDHLSFEEIKEKSSVQKMLPQFEKKYQVERVTEFITDIIESNK
ncbi:MAG: glycosyltransferase [Bdellovibrio sp.]|nr:glycosyltransferase [Bdellovibrio sp.]